VPLVGAWSRKPTDGQKREEARQQPFLRRFPRMTTSTAGSATMLQRRGIDRTILPLFGTEASRSSEQCIESCRSSPLNCDGVGFDIPALHDQYRRFLESIFTEEACYERLGFAWHECQVVVLP